MFAIAVHKLLNRKLQTWEICVPAQLVADAEKLFQSDDTFTRLEPKRPAPASRIHTYSRFGTVGSNHEFVIVPDCDVHLDCCSDIIVRSPRGLPYPSLKAFAQSCIDRRNQLELSDFIDGTDVSEEWGEEHLDLDGVHDVSWVLGMQEKDSGSSMPSGWPTRAKSKRAIWASFVRTKKERLDSSRPESRYVTQFRHRDSKDPWTQLSDMS